MVSRRKALTGLLAGGTGMAAAVILTSRDARRWVFGPTTFATDSRLLAIPESMPGELRDGVRTYDLGLQRRLSRFFDGIETQTLGINGTYLGPTLRMSAGETVQMNVTNRIGNPALFTGMGFFCQPTLMAVPIRLSGTEKSGRRDLK